MGLVVSATEARIRFGELMRQAVENRETIIIELSWFQGAIREISDFSL